jgi:hypothetical protein
MKKALTILSLPFLIIIFFLVLNKPQEEVTNFEQCVAAGNPIMESYPAQCIHKDQHFVQEIKESPIDPQ